MNGKSDASRNSWTDPDDAPELDKAFFEKAQWHIGERPVSREAGRQAVQRGRPRKANPKIQVSIRYSAEVIEHFRATGRGWQTRMDEALKQWIAEHGKD